MALNYFFCNVFKLLSNYYFHITQSMFINCTIPSYVQPVCSKLFNLQLPFISIPVKRALDMSKGAVANFNIGSLLLSGAIVFVTAFVLPVALKLIDQKLMPLPVHPGFGRSKYLVVQIDPALIKHFLKNR